jgi:hypothetical protein
VELLDDLARAVAGEDLDPRPLLLAARRDVDVLRRPRHAQLRRLPLRRMRLAAELELDEVRAPGPRFRPIRSR